MSVAQGNLAMVGVHTPTPQVFWNGIEVLGIVSIKVDHEVGDEHRVKLKVFDAAQDDLLVEMAAAGIVIKKLGV